MKPNLQDYTKFYRWLTLPFTKKPSRIQVLQRTNRILTFAMPGIYGLVFCWLFLKKTSMGGIWPFIWIPALSCLASFVIGSTFRDLMRSGRFNHYQKKIHPDIPFLADMYFLRPLSRCVSVSCRFRLECARCSYLFYQPLSEFLEGFIIPRTFSSLGDWDSSGEDSFCWFE